MKKPLKSCLIIFLLFVFVFIVGIMIMFLAKFCPPAGPWPMPPWCLADSQPFSFPWSPNSEGSSIDSSVPNSDDFAYYSAEDMFQALNSNLVLDATNVSNSAVKFNADGIAWFALADDPWSPSSVNRFHKNGLHLIGASMTIRHLNVPIPLAKTELAALDIDGHPIPLTKPGMAGYLKGEYFYSIFNPAWQQLLLEQGKSFIEMGAEGISMDEPNTYGSLVFEYGGSFDDYSLAAFRDYLAVKYSPEELSSLFEIDNIATFDFREYLIEKGMRETWNQSQQQPPLITHEFFLCQNKGAADFLHRFSTEMKEYAATFGRQFVLAYNASPQYTFSNFLPIDFLDYLVGEGFYFSHDHIRAALSRKMLNGVFDRPIFYLVEVGLDTGLIPQQTKNLFKYMFADIFSSSGTGMIVPSDGFYTMKNGGYLPEDKKIQMDISEANRYIDFMKANSSLFGLSEPAEVAVVVSIPSLTSYYLPSSDSLWGASETFTVMEMLLNHRIPYDTITSGNGIWSDASLTREYLSQYKVVLLPNVDLIADEEVEAMLDFARNGGTVIQINNFASFDSTAKRVIRAELAGLQGTGTYQLGSGTWVNLGYLDGLNDYRWDETENRQVLPSEQSFDFPQAVKIIDTVQKYHEPEMVSDAPITVTFRRYVDDQRIVLHLVNTDYDQTTDSFTTPGSFQVTLNTAGLQLSAVRLYGFESAEIMDIDFSQVGDEVSIIIPDLFAYSIVEFVE